MTNIHKILSVRQSKYSIFAAFLLLFNLVLVLFACEQEIVPDKQDGPVLQLEGEKIAVNFTVSESGFGDNEVVTPRNAPSIKEGFGLGENIVIPIADNIAISRR